MTTSVLEKGTLSFSIEGRVLRELGERLVKHPEVAIVELIKNSYDADATECTIDFDSESSITVSDNGSGMTLDRFISGWMRIGTSSKESIKSSERFSRQITGEKGIGRFAVRFLGTTLHLESVAEDPKWKKRTRLIADFNWPQFDRYEDLGEAKVPYRLELSDSATPTGTILVVSSLRFVGSKLNLDKVRTNSIDVLSPLGSLLQQVDKGNDNEQRTYAGRRDPGLTLIIREESQEDNRDVAATVLDGFTLRACLRLEGDKLDLRIFRRGSSRPAEKIIDTYPNYLQRLDADIRFFPRRKAAFVGLPIDGRRAYRWIAENSGVAVFDRRFRVSPYGMELDDWLQLDADAARNRREPRSKIAAKHFPMSPEERGSTAENWMLRLPQSAQLVGLVSVEGQRTKKGTAKRDEGLIASADREGFVENDAFRQLQDLVRGAVEAIACVDRRLQQEKEQSERDALLFSIRQETQSAIEEIQSNPNISKRDKVRIVAALAQTEKLAEKQRQITRERERQLEVMSLLGVVAGFMTHEFDDALYELEGAHAKLIELGKRDRSFEAMAQKFAVHTEALKDFVIYSSGYIQGSKMLPDEPYRAKPRLQQVKRKFGRYAAERGIEVEIDIASDLEAPLVPVSLYNGIALNLFTNALKAVTAKVGTAQSLIAFRAWNNNQWHYLEVSDTGVGIPSALKDRVFDPLFTTTASRRDPLGSGMGLGLTLVKRSVESFGGHAEVVEPPPGFSTCVRVRLPLQENRRR